LNVYTDTSFLVSLYTQDSHSVEAHTRMALKPSVWFTPLHAAEFCHAVAQQVFFGRASLADADSVYDDLHRDRVRGLWSETFLPDHAFELSADLGRRYGPKLGIRTYDTLHVACALELKADCFWTFDERQAKLAKAQGLKTS
jgi:predicted nucleic acid-binding protein